MTTMTDLSRDEQYRLVYQGICAVASHCDGALSEDGVGFNGQDTKFGKRIASVPFEAWTQDVQEEAARIALTYKAQILAYIGVDMFELEVVKEATGHATNRQARDDARTYERRAKKGDLLRYRQIVRMDPASNVIGIAWAKGDPDFQALYAAVKALPRKADWDGSWWKVAACVEIKAIAEKFNIVLDAETDTYLSNLPKTYSIGVLKGSNGQRLWIKADYNADRVVEARKLPGRRWNRELELDEVDATPEVLAFAERWGLEISPKAQAAINSAGEDAADVAGGFQAKLTKAELLLRASAVCRPEELDASFIALVQNRSK